MDGELIKRVISDLSIEEIEEACNMFPQIGEYKTHPKRAEHYMKLYLWCKYSKVDVRV